MKILKSKIEKEKSGRANHTAFDVSGRHARLEKLELALEELGRDVFLDRALVLFFGHSLQCLVAPLTRLDVHVGHPLVAVLDANEPLAPETRICDVEVETSLVGNLDGLNRSGENVMVRTMFTPKPIEMANDLTRVGRETSFPQLGFEFRRERLVLFKTHMNLLSCLFRNVLSATATVTDYRLTMIPIMLKSSILDHKSQEAASAASWEYLKIFLFCF
ncbi:hypothetical protein A3A20_01400 [Candidatus Wolfebacteria bacterium RIFCSPLOWO2_01_FULL_45_19]|uniref:Uncharacterized protein n=1 Tax=Candidatus Wolfebacteria bacterium RIFCSPLOWO2_01_FULL_45_19 TaxID=1802557 RepID=A0A1F8DSI4_9BACT|nr:MAG: hypothetical protein A3A20_01400 [Candidatus Wolfebacteria bacterium RIFCSPLOWO2_01_FULL_45_19]